MKRVVSVSLGSSSRNHCSEITLKEQQVKIERIGTDGDVEAAINLIKELDGKVDAIGLGGIDRYLYAGSTKYEIREARKLATAAPNTPVVDGSGLKNTLERNVVKKLINKGLIDINKKILLVSGVDRFGMAQAFEESGADVTYGDLIFGLGMPVPLQNLKTLERIAKVIVPVICRLPIKYVYPTGSEQKIISDKNFKYYQQADIIAGDYLFIKRYMSGDMTGKIIVTNTVTERDMEELRQKNVSLVITTTPEIEGRSYGTNVMEALLVALSDKKRPLIEEEYYHLVSSLKIEPRIQVLNKLEEGENIVYA